MATEIIAGDAVVEGGIVGGNDGALALRVGPNGAKVNGLSIDSAGVPTFIKQPVVPVQSMVRVHTANGYGSTNTKIRRFTTTVTNQGTDITYADSATLGASFTINTAGVYAISYMEQQSTADWSGISLNSSQLTTSINAINTADILGAQAGWTPNVAVVNAWTGYLPAGSVLRPHTVGAAAGTGPAAQFTIVRVA